jgi:tetratricopeptide (TPR) repeat protein
MGTRFILIIALLIVRGAAALEADQRFASSLFDKNEYRWALVEYERLLFAYPDSSAASLWHFRSGECHRAMNQHGKAIEEFDAALALDPTADSARLFAADCAMRLKRVAVARPYLAACHLDFAKVLLAYADCFSHDYSSAQRALADVPEGSPSSLKAHALSKVIETAQTFHRKSYAVAGMLAIVPGAGHLYAGRRGDAAMTALMVSTGALITGYYAYNKARTQEYTAGTITGLLYAGSIYGALLSVKIYNSAATGKLRAELERIVFEP